MVRSSPESPIARCAAALLIAWLLALPAVSTAQDGDAKDAQNRITAVDYSVKAGNALELRFELASPPQKPRAFTIREPARIALDFAGTANATGKRRIPIGVGVASSLNLVEAQGQTRAVLNLTRMAKYKTRVEGNSVIVSLGQGRTGTAQGERASAQTVAQTQASQGDRSERGADDPASALQSVDFRRGENGQGRVLVNLASADTPVGVERRGQKIVVELPGTRIPSDQLRRLDVLDFATPVKYIDIRQRGDRGLIEIVPRNENYKQVAFQSGSRLTVELKPLTEEEVQRRKDKEDEYTGKKLSLNFQSISVRSVLQLLADFTGLNVVVSDSVQGKLTLRLKEVPWDQALDIILRSEGLDKRRNGNVIFVAPREEIAAREQARLKAQKKERELAPLRTEYIRINYADATKIAQIIQSDSGSGGNGEDGKAPSLLSDRASVTVDQRTNTLLVRATGQNLARVRKLIQKLDVPVRQVMIESRIVIANNDFSKELGVRFGVNRDTTGNGPSGSGVVVSGDRQGTQDLVNNETLENGRYNVNLPTSNPSGSVDLALAKLPFGTFLELELSAMQAEGRGEVISTPRVITANQNEASIQQGVQVPFQEASSSGATSTSFKEAVLELNVTPRITPDGRIIMELEVKKDQVGQVFNGVPSIDTQRVATRVLVDNGETVVLGGIYEQTKRKDVERVPFFGELPLVGQLFRNTRRENDKSELLIFVTPKIVKGGTGVNY